VPASSLMTVVLPYQISFGREARTPTVGLGGCPQARPVGRPRLLRKTRGVRSARDERSGATGEKAMKVLGEDGKIAIWVVDAGVVVFRYRDGKGNLDLRAFGRPMRGSR